ncbi:MAG: hypothetical protein WCK76_09430 [Elusimicrobiota bacterium]
MKISTGAMVLMLMTSFAGAGEMENVYMSGNFGALDLSAARTAGVPAPSQELYNKAKPGSIAAWVDAVKKAYVESLDAGADLPEAALLELPAAARRQLQKDTARYWPNSPSVAYKLVAQGEPAYVLSNHNDTFVGVTIYDAAGARIASGSLDERNGKFSWDDKAGAKRAL